MDEARRDVHGEVTYQHSLLLEVVLPAVDERGIEYVKVSQQLLEDPH